MQNEITQAMVSTIGLMHVIFTQGTNRRSFSYLSALHQIIFLNSYKIG